MKSFFTRFFTEPRITLRRLISCFFCWHYPQPRGNAADAQIILTQAAPNLTDGQSGKSNYELADLAEFYAVRFQIPIFPQAEVGVLLAHSAVHTVGTTGRDSDVDQFSQDYMGSGGVAQLQKDYCDAHEITKVLVVAFHPHFWRALWIYERLGLTVIIPHNIPKLHFGEEYSQVRWRRAVTAYPYELLARLYFFYKGEI